MRRPWLWQQPVSVSHITSSAAAVQIMNMYVLAGFNIRCGYADHLTVFDYLLAFFDIGNRELMAERYLFLNAHADADVFFTDIRNHVRIWFNVVHHCRHV